MTPDDWPPLPTAWPHDSALDKERRRLIVRAQIHSARVEKATEPPHPASQADDESEKKLHENLATLSVGSIERSRDGAKFIETAAAALGTIYAAILGLVFAASDKPLPGRGLYAAVFLGIAIVGAAFYLGFIRRIQPLGRVTYSTSRPEDMWRRTEWLAEWTSKLASTRSWALRGAVFALAFGVAFMPAAFLPAKLSANTFGGIGQDGSPQPTVSWPLPPTDIQNPDLAALLYKAQLDEFVKTLHEPAEATGAIDTNVLLFWLFVTCLGATVVVAASGPVEDGLGRAAKRLRNGQGKTKPATGADSNGRL